MKQRNRRSLLGALGATVAAGALALGGAVAANAEPTENWPGFLPDPALKDNGGSITLTKLRTPDDGAPLTAEGDNHGGALTVPEGAIPINGIGYTLWQSEDFDLLTEAGWQQASTLQPPEQDNGGWKADYTDADGTKTATFTSVEVDDETVLETDENGQIQWEELAFGVYILQEVSAPGNVLVNPKTYYITVPMTNPAGTAWMYDINVYPKDLELTADKSVDDLKALSPADDWNTITWTIEVPAIQFPGDRDDNTLDAVVLTDQLPAGVSWTTGDITVTPTPDTNPAPVVTKEGNTGAADGKITVTWGTVESSGAAAALLGKDIEVAITAKVVNPAATYQTLGELKNTADIDVYTDSSSDKTATITTDEVTSKYAGATFNKMDGSTALEGAKFALYASREDAVNTTKNFVAEGATSTGSDGTVTFTNLKLSDWAEDTTQVAGTSEGEEEAFECVANTAFQVYWLVETKAPKGYELLPQPIPVQLVKGDGETYEFQRITQVSEDDGALVWETVPTVAGQECKYKVTTFDQIENVEHNAGFDLPLTGGWGTVWLMVAGGVLLGLVLVVARRRRAEEV